LEITYNSFAKMIEIDVRSTIIECHAADSNYIASQEMFGSATESYDLTNSNFKQGSGQFSDLQLSDELLQQSELGLIQCKLSPNEKPRRLAHRYGQGNHFT
jgi:outer membrane protein TolC